MAKANMAEVAEPTEQGDAPLIDLNEGSIKKLVARAKKRGYITVDDQLRTNVAHIWAMGDCNGRGAPISCGRCTSPRSTPASSI